MNKDEIKLIDDCIKAYKNMIEYHKRQIMELERKKLKPNMKMIFGGLVGQAMQDMIVHNLTLEQVLKGKK